ncbi:MAG: hypothetical protein K2N43_02505 [Lachnospiraceae bacterium]|nr:hypothetical protein [Lachnospiraceae bacterium]
MQINWNKKKPNKQIMQRYNKLRNNFYSADLLYGKIDLNPIHTFFCFFIVEHTFDEEFIKDQAIQLLLAGCQSFDFYGKAELNWYLGVDEANLFLRPKAASETNVLTSGWDTLEEFADALNSVLSMRTIVPHDIYLIYDDEEIYKNVMKRIGIPEEEFFRIY